MFALKATTSEWYSRDGSLPSSSSSPYVPRLSLNVETTWLDLSLCLSPAHAQLFTHKSLSKHVELNYNQLLKALSNFYLIFLPFWWNTRGADFWYLKNFYLMGDEGESYYL